MAMINTIPEVTFVVALLSLAVSLIYGVGRRLLTNVKEIKRMTAELSAYNKERRQAITSGDKEKVAKLRKRDAQMKMAQSKVAMQNMKPTFAFFIPFSLLWFFGIPAIIGSNWADVIAAKSPVPLNFIPFYPLTFGAENTVSVFVWYLITSFAFQGMVSKLLKLT